MEIKSAEQDLGAVELIRAWAITKLPEKQPSPWNGHSPEQCMLLNVLSGLNRYSDILRSMAGTK